MKFPNKIISYKESVLSRFPLVLDILENNDYSIGELFNVVKAHMEDVIDFIDILDCLFALGKVKLNEQTRRLNYVE